MESKMEQLRSRRMKLVHALYTGQPVNIVTTIDKASLCADILLGIMTIEYVNQEVTGKNIPCG